VRIDGVGNAAALTPFDRLRCAAWQVRPEALVRLRHCRRPFQFQIQKKETTQPAQTPSHRRKLLDHHHLMERQLGRQLRPVEIQEGHQSGTRRVRHPASRRCDSRAAVRRAQDPNHATGYLLVAGVEQVKRRR